MMRVIIGVSMNPKEKYKVLKPLLDEIKGRPYQHTMHIKIDKNQRPTTCSSYILTVQYITERISIMFEEYNKPDTATVCYSYYDSHLCARDGTSIFTSTQTCGFQNLLLFMYIYSKTKNIIAKSPYAKEIKKIYRNAIQNGINRNIKKLKNHVK